MQNVYTHIDSLSHFHNRFHENVLLEGTLAEEQFEDLKEKPPLPVLNPTPRQYFHCRFVSTLSILLTSFALRETGVSCADCGNN